MKIGIRTWILIVCLVLAILAISPSFSNGALIKSVERNSTAYNEGVRAGSIISSLNGMPIENSEDYADAISRIFVSNSTNATTKIDLVTDDGEYIFLNIGSLGLSVSDVPRTHIKTGLDLSGGARALVRASNATLNDQELADLIAITEERLNTFGLSDVTVRAVSDLSGNKFMLIEIAGATPEDIRQLVGSQGQFTATVGNTTVFSGGKGSDITDVCRNNAECSGLRSCQADSASGGYMCRFDFVIYLSDEAAQRHADITKAIPLDQSGQYLSESLHLYIDNVEVDSLLISANLKGQKTTQISIQGSGTGSTQDQAAADARLNMKKLQTILITGSLPYKLEIVKLDSISPSLGKQFTKSLAYLGLLVFVLVSVAIFIRYKKVKLTLAVMLTMVSEALLTLGIAALIRWNLDAPGIAGIIAGIGTGVNDQIVLLDEASHGADKSTVKERIKRALFIIIGAFMTIVAAMLPLFWAGAGLLRGFALTTILGVTVGILITRPAFAEIIRKVEEHN